MRVPWSRQPQTALEAARAAYLATRRYGNVDRSASADEWCAEAVAAGDPVQAAEAYWERIIAGAEDSARQVPLDRRHQFLGSGTGVLAEAGYWQLAAGRVEQAARILEIGRGVLMRRSAGSLSSAQRATLTERGHGDLLARYLHAIAILAQLLRDQYRPATSIAGRHPMKGHDPLMAARETVETIESEIGAVLGPRSEPITYDEIRAAAADAPLVYLAAAGDTGYAVVVRRQGFPQSFWLPALRRDEIAARAADLGRRTVTVDVPADAVGAALGELTPALADLAAHLRNEPVITLVAVGALSLLPVHAAFGDPGPAIRHIPSAHALPAYTQPVTATTRVLAVRAERPRLPPGAIPLPDLRLARPQTALLKKMYGARLTTAADARANQVLADLATADVCHFMCHGRFSPDQALDGSLLLADRPLTLSEILARDPFRQRLIILGACESSVPDPRVLDETLSFPGAMMQAGAAGVVAALWRVREPAAALVLQRFHEELAGGRPPATALAAAQRWLRHATYGEITQAYPGFYVDRLCARSRVPFDHPVDWAAFTCTGV